MSDSTNPTEPKLPDWDGIQAEGGIEAWIEAELRRRDLWVDDADTSQMSDTEKKQLKARYEELRRVRKILYDHAWAAYKQAHIIHLGRGVFYHDTVDVDRFDLPDPEQRRQENEIPEIRDARHLAELLGMTVSRLRWLAYHREVDTGTHYRTWMVPKRTGGQRLISAPRPVLKKAQRWIARNITEHLPVHGAAHGFLAGRSTRTNASPHHGSRMLIKLDIKDFYPTITQRRVRGIFRKAGYNEQVATVLSMLCTEAPREEIDLRGCTHYVAIGPRSLPQGAPTSPSLTNTLSRRLDARMSALAHKLGYRYTRYADDMTFSWHDRDTGKARVGLLLRIAEGIIASEGFQMHGKKTRVLRVGRRQQVTGLVVNPAPVDAPVARVPRKTLRRLRAAIHNRKQGKPGKPGETLQQLKGMAAYVYMTDPAKGRKLLDALAELES